MSTLAVSFFAHDSYDDVYATLARIFPVKSGEAHEWVEIRLDDVASLTFFAPDNTESLHAA